MAAATPRRRLSGLWTTVGPLGGLLPLSRARNSWRHLPAFGRSRRPDPGPRFRTRPSNPKRPWPFEAAEETGRGFQFAAVLRTPGCPGLIACRRGKAWSGTYCKRARCRRSVVKTCHTPRSGVRVAVSEGRLLFLPLPGTPRHGFSLGRFMASACRPRLARILIDGPEGSSERLRAGSISHLDLRYLDLVPPPGRRTGAAGRPGRRCVDGKTLPDSGKIAVPTQAPSCTGGSRRSPPWENPHRPLRRRLLGRPPGAPPRAPGDPRSSARYRSSTSSSTRLTRRGSRGGTQPAARAKSSATMRPVAPQMVPCGVRK